MGTTGWNLLFSGAFHCGIYYDKRILYGYGCGGNGTAHLCGRRMPWRDAQLKKKRLYYSERVWYTF